MKRGMASKTFGKRACILLLFCLCLAMSGCSSRQLEEQLLVIALGIDETEESRIHLTVKVPSNSGSGNEGGGGESASSGGEQMGYLMLEATGRTFSDAMNLLHATTPRVLNFSQTGEVVLGADAAASPRFAGLLEDVMALPRMRANSALVICREQAQAFIEAQKPYIGIRLSRYIETTLTNYAGKGFVPTTSLGEAVRDLGYGFQDPLLTYGAINDFSAPEQEERLNVLDAEAGSLPRKSVNRVELFGAAATDGVAVSGVLTGYEMALLHLVRGDVQSLNVETRDGLAVPVFATHPAALAVEKEKNPVRLTLQLTCEAHVTPGTNPDLEELRQTIVQDLTAAIRHMQALRCDGLGFGSVAVRGMRTVRDWEAFAWRDTYAAADVQVSVTLHRREN